MRNLDFPVQQALFENASALYAARHAEASRRIAGDNPDEVFTTYMHGEMRRVEVYGSLGDTGMTLITGGAMKLSVPRLDKTLAEVTAIGQQVDPDTEMTTTTRELKIIDFLSAQFDKSPDVEQLQWLGVLALLAGCNKPVPSVAEAVVRQRAPGEPAEYEVFRRAVRRLRSHSLRPGEEELITARHDRYVDSINRSKPDAPRARTALNRYGKGIFAGRMVDRLMDPSLRRSHVMDEIDFSRGSVPEPRHIPPTPGYTSPIVRLPWPMLAKTRKEGDSGKRSDGPPASQLAEDDPKITETAALAHQTAWIDDLAETWPGGGERVRVDDLPTGNRKRPYQGALLYNRFGEPFVFVADTAERENAMYYAASDRLRDPDTGKPVPLLEAFKGNKPQARARGAEYIDHVGQDFYAKRMERIQEDALRSEKTAG